MTKVLVVTSDPVGPKMAGPAIRTWNIAQVLAGEGHEVRLVTTSLLEAQPAPFEQFRVVGPLESGALADLLRTQDAYIAPSRDDPCSNALLEALA